MRSTAPRTSTVLQGVSALLTTLLLATAQAEIDEHLSKKGQERPRRPLYEIGIGGGTSYFMHYPGADQGKWRSIALPTFLYRGSVFRADEEDGLRAKLIASQWYGVELSGAGAWPVPSSENDARHGMPDLELLGEGGPQLYFRTQKSEWLELRLLIALRGAMSTNFSTIRYRGFVFAPGVDLRMLLPGSAGAFKMKVSPLFATDAYQEYYYSVPAEYATTTRRAYQAFGGYLGTKTDIGYSIDWNRLSLFTTVSYHNFHGARNSDSPLFKREHFVSGFIGLSWLLYQSDELEDARP